MMKLYFHDNQDNLRFIKEFEDIESVINALPTIVASLNPNYKIYYIRYYCSNGVDTIFDIGSHTEEFILRKED